MPANYPKPYLLNRSPILIHKFNSSFRHFRFNRFNGPTFDLENTLERFGTETIPLIRRHLTMMRAVILQLVATVQYKSANPFAAPPTVDNPAFLTTTNTKIFPVDNLRERYNVLSNQIMERNANFVREKSGLVLHRVIYFDYFFEKYNPLAGRGYKQLPRKLAVKKAIVNVQNTDERCFAYAVCAARHTPLIGISIQTTRTIRAATSQTTDSTIFSIPSSRTRIPQIERDINQFKINVFGFNDEDGLEPYPIFVSRRPNEDEQEVDLLYFDEHYATIKDFSRFACGVTKHEDTSVLLQALLLPLPARERVEEAQAHLHARGLQLGHLGNAPGRRGPPVPELEVHRPRPRRHLRRLRGDLQSLLPDDEHLSADGARPQTLRAALHKPIAIGAYIVTEVPIFEGNGIADADTRRRVSTSPSSARTATSSSCGSSSSGRTS